MEKTEAKKAIEELTMILMYLSSFVEDNPYFDTKDCYAWKGYNFDTINELWDKDYIRQGKHPSKTKKVYITNEGIAYAKTLMEKYQILDWDK